MSRQLGATPTSGEWSAQTPTPAGPITELTGPLEAEVLRMVAAGLTNKAIAAELFLSERTVDRHVSNLLGQARGRLPDRGAAYAYERGRVTGTRMERPG